MENSWKIACRIMIFTLCVLGFFCAIRYWVSGRKIEYSYRPSTESFGNPLMGFAPCAWYESVSADVNLLYMDITWRELEPEEGQFDWESIEEENQLNRWRQEGKHIVLRFVCDIPDDDPHRDIPDWLYDKIGGDGTQYHTSYGYGFSPNYGNPLFIEYHNRAVAALGQRYGQDGFISFVELGSLGHWGEWHVKYSAGVQKLPLQEIRRQYVTAWVEAFPKAHVMMRRPFAEAKEYNLGLFNDMAGHPESTCQWLDWIEQGGSYDQTDEENAIVPMKDIWKTAPIGGELTSSLEMEYMLDENLIQTAALIRESHTTFLGPQIANPEYQTGYYALIRNMGYRLWISHIQIQANPFAEAQVILTWQNDGVAPFYESWPVYLYVTDEEGNLLQKVPVEVDLRSILPGTVITSKTTVPSIDFLEKTVDWAVWLGIVDPMTGENAVTFAMEDVLHTDGRVLLCKG